MKGAFAQAVSLLVTGDSEVWFITWTSLRFSLSSAVIACVPGIPLGVLLALKRFRGRRPLLAVLNTLMALPTVVVGIVVYSFISRSGPLGGLGLLFTPAAVIVGQAILALPLSPHHDSCAAPVEATDTGEDIGTHRPFAGLAALKKPEH